PHGALNATVREVSAELGYAIINWSVDPFDWRDRNADVVYEAIMSHVHNNAIILTQDLYASTADAVERVIPELISRGYQLVTVTELMYYSGITMQAGVVYCNG
ncbi:MAG: polysaccharide deacetylase, partial [Oscillospiraceae bacterium]|nr:polysaccharide deacetylase [Oscillospiraceae bacterium]